MWRAFCSGAGVAHLSRLTALLIGFTLAACGGKSLEEGGDEPGAGGTSSQGNTGNVAGSDGGTGVGGKGQGGSGHAGTSSKGGTATGGSSSGGTGQGGAGQGGQGGNACEAFKDDAGAYIRVEILNQTSETIYLGERVLDCYDPPKFAVQDGAGRGLLLREDCRQSCEVVGSGGPVGCPALCALPQVISLMPGESYRTSWDGLELLQKQLPKECVVAPNGVAECSQAVRIQPGAFTFSSNAGSAIECAISSNPCQTCQPTGFGGCAIQGAQVSGPLIKASVQVELDSSFGIYPKTAPAPGAPRPGGDGAIALQSVIIVFK